MRNGQISPDPKVFLEKVSFLALSVDYENHWCSGLGKGGIPDYRHSRWVSSPWVLFLWAPKYLQGYILTLCARGAAQDFG